jgi:hypothetical protein
MALDEKWVYFLVGAGVACGTAAIMKRQRRGARPRHLPGPNRHGHPAPGMSYTPAGPAAGFQPRPGYAPPQIAVPQGPGFQQQAPGLPFNDSPGMPAGAEPSFAGSRRASAVASGAPPAPVGEYHEEGTLGGERF